MESLRAPLWGGLPPPAYAYHKSGGRSSSSQRFGSSLELRETCPASAQQCLLPRRQRSPSLPPIVQGPAGKDKQNELKDASSKFRYEDGGCEGETSGYASDTAQPSPDYWCEKANKGTWKGSTKAGSGSESGRLGAPISAWNHQRAQQGATSTAEHDEPRPKWGDRGIAAGRFWEPHDPDARLPQVTKKGTPAWVERSLNMIDNGDTQILVIDQHSNHSSGGDTVEYRATSEEKNTYLLGQNVPIEPNIKAEREYRRQKALELQADIVRQLEDRQRQKKEERERRIREEREEEERFRRQQELERQRLAEERRVIEEKQRREQKRAEALRVALEKAEQQAKVEKENKKNRKLREQFDAMSLHASDHEPSHRSVNDDLANAKKRDNGESSFFGAQDNNQQPRPRGLSTEMVPSSLKEPSNAVLHHEAAPMSLVQIPALAADLFNPMNFHGAAGGVQMALLVPQTGLYPCVHQAMAMHQPMSMHQPISMHTLFSMEQRNASFASAAQTVPDATEAKTLTPSKYRNPNHRDASTQTDAVVEKATPDTSDEGRLTERKSKLENRDNNSEREKLHSSDEKLHTKRDHQRGRPEERISAQHKDLESRPKWGVNKPHTQYKKQSEKDVFYAQKRKLRQRKRAQEKAAANYATSHSSDDNGSPSPVRTETRMSLSDYHWKKRQQSEREAMYRGANVTVETTQILPLECDPSSGAVHVGEDFHHQRKVTYGEKKQPPKRGVTLTEKFMNDKYGNPKLWRDSSDNKTKYEEDGFIKENKLDARKRYMDSVNSAKKELSDYYGRSVSEEPTNQPLVLDQLKSLRDSLKKQQRIWGKYEAAGSPPSPKRECDLEME